MVRSTRIAAGRTAAAWSWLFAGLIVGGCGPDPVSSFRFERFLLPPFVRAMPLSTLQAAPESLVVQGRALDVDVALWWNLGPSIGPPERRGLIAAVTLRAPEEADFPAGIEAKYLWVIRDEVIWRTALFVEDPDHFPPNEVVSVGRWGPDYDGRTTATAVVGVVVDGPGLVLVRVPDIAILTPM